MDKLEQDKFFKFAETLNKFTYLINPIGAEIKRQQMRSISKQIREENIAKYIKENKTDELNIQNKTRGTNYKKINFDPEIDLNLASNIFNQAIKTGLIANTYSGLLKCNIAISDLAKSKDGMLRGFKIAPQGGIEQQAKFIEVNLPTPLIAFQVASFVTGQYYQHIITEQLETLNKKIDDILSYLLNTDKSTIQSMFNTFKNLYHLKKYKDSDFNLPQFNLQKLEIIKQNYLLQLKEIKFDVKHSKQTNLDEAKSWEIFFLEKRIYQKINICYWAEMLHYMYCVLLIKMELNRENNSSNEQIMERVKIYYNIMDNNFGTKYSKIYHTIKYTILLNLEYLYIDAFYGKKDIEEIKNSLKQNFDEIENLFRVGQNKLKTDFYYKYENGIPTGKLIEI